MSTTALNSVQIGNKNSIMPQEKSTRQIVREEIKRAQELEKLEEKYKAGEISDFEYRVQKYMLNHISAQIGSKDRHVVMSTTA